MSNGAGKFSPFPKMSSTAGNEWSNCRFVGTAYNECVQLKHNLDNITSQKWGARHIGEPHDHKSGGGLEPLGPIGVYAYGYNNSKMSFPTLLDVYIMSLAILLLV